MKITDIDYIGTHDPYGSGTGYSSIDKFCVKLDNRETKTIEIDIYYRTPDSFRDIFIEAINKHIPNVANMDEAFEMYINQIMHNGLCCYIETNEDIKKYKLF